MPPAPGTEQHAWHGSSTGPGTDVARWRGRRGQRGDALRVPAPQRALGSGAQQTALRVALPAADRGSPRGTHLADGTAEALGPAHLPTQRSELHPALYTAPVAAHPSQTAPLLLSSAAGVSRSPRRALGSTRRPTVPSRPIVPSAGRALPGGGYAAPHTPTEQLRASLVVPDTQIKWEKVQRGKTNSLCQPLTGGAAAPRSRRGDGKRRRGRRGTGVGATRGCGARDGAEGGKGRPSPIRG